jgi:hypothetical protein
LALLYSSDELAAVLEPEWRSGKGASREVLAAHLAQPGAETALDAVLRLDNMSMASGGRSCLPDQT